MRLHSYIIGESRTTHLNQDKAIDLIRKNCKRHVTGLVRGSRPTIYRGTYLDSIFSYLDPRGQTRDSANTTNHMTLLMDNLPSWKGYPKRSESVICSLREDYTRNYGQTYQVYPYDKCNIGIVPSSDVWMGFKDINKDSLLVSDFNDNLSANLDIQDISWKSMVKSMEQMFNSDIYKTFDDLLSIDGDIQEAQNNVIVQYGFDGDYKISILHDYVTDSIKSYAKRGIKPSKGIMDYLDRVLSPRYNGFKLNKLPTGSKEHEVWIGDAPVILVSNKFSDFLKDEGLK